MINHYYYLRFGVLLVGKHSACCMHVFTPPPPWVKAIGDLSEEILYDDAVIKMLRIKITEEWTMGKKRPASLSGALASKCRQLARLTKLPIIRLSCMHP